jgi:hypothetical protein
MMEGAIEEGETTCQSIEETTVFLNVTPLDCYKLLAIDSFPAFTWKIPTILSGNLAVLEPRMPNSFNVPYYSMNYNSPNHIFLLEKPPSDSPVVLACH